MRSLRPLAALALLAWQPGCASFRATLPATPAAAATETVVREGWNIRQYAVPVELLETATLETLNELRFWELRPQDLQPDGLRIQARSSDSRRATIVVQPAPGGSQVAARIGRFSDQTLARQVVDRVGMRLGLIPYHTSADPESSGAFAGGGNSASPRPRSAVPDSVMLQDQVGSQYSEWPTP
jgi:hypothetical protein